MADDHSVSISIRNFLILSALLFVPVNSAHSSVHSIFLKGGVMSLLPRSETVQAAPTIPYVLPSENLTGPAVELGYGYFPEQVNWLGVTLRVGYYSVNGSMVTGPAFAVTNVTVEPRTTYDVQVIPVKIGPKISLLASDVDSQWEKSHLYLGTGLGYYSRTQDAETKFIIQTPNFAWASTGTNELKVKSSSNQSGVSGYISAGGAYFLTDEMSLSLDYEYDLFIRGSIVAGAVSFHFK